MAGEHPVLFTGFEDATRVRVPDTDHMLPPQIAKFSLEHQIIDDQHVSFIQGSGHGGSHPHMVHEWISAILEGRPAHVSARVAGVQWHPERTAPSDAFDRLWMRAWFNLPEL